MRSVIEMAREAGLERERWNTTEQFHMFLERFAVVIREDERQQHENLNCKSVQKRLATMWGYVLPEQSK